MSESVDLALSLDGRDADPSDTEAADSERVGVTPVAESAGSGTAAADICGLNLAHVYVARQRLALQAWRGAARCIGARGEAQQSGGA